MNTKSEYSADERRGRRALRLRVSPVLLAAGFAAMTLTAAPSSGVEPEDVSVHIAKGSFEKGSLERWHADSVTVSLDASLSRLGPEAALTTQQAFGAWLGSERGLPDLSFDHTSGAKVSQAPDGQNSVMVAPIQIDGHEHDLAITIAFSDKVSGEIIEADIVINARHPWKALSHAVERQGGSSCQGDRPVGRACQGEYDLESVMAHEVGHFFGLEEAHQHPSATMFPCSSPCETHKRTLEAVDQDAIAALYQDAASGDTASGTYFGGESTFSSTAGCSLTGERGASSSRLSLWLLLGLAAFRRKAG